MQYENISSLCLHLNKFQKGRGEILSISIIKKENSSVWVPEASEQVSSNTALTTQTN